MTDISIKIGLAEGNAKFYILKRNDFINFVFEGEGINKTAEAEHFSSPGEIVFIKNNKFLKIKDKIPLKIEEKIEEKVDENHLFNFLPNSLKDFLKEGKEEFLNEHKNCVILFINLEKANLKKIYKETSNILKKYSGYFLKIDCGDKGDKFIILFGIPYQISEPINNAFDFLLEFKELAKIEDFIFKAGVNYSKIFAGILGSKERCEYTVLGDGVNLSARLMQISSRNEITTLKELMQKTSDNYLFNQELPVQFKGKTGLFDLYKLIERRTYKPPITSFYGRKKELLNLSENFNDNSFFCIYGEMGCGKTAFSTYFLDQFSKRPFYYVNCLFSEKETPYNCIKKFLEIYFNVNYKAKNIEDFFNDFLDKNLFVPKIYLPIFLNTFFEFKLKEPALDAEYKKSINFKILYEFLNFESKEKEICIFFDNGHNIDFLSFEFLLNFYKLYERKNLKTIFNDREKKGGFDFYLELKNFEKEELKKFLNGLLKVVDIPKNFLEKIYNSTKGNALLLKETIASCISSGYILKDEEYPEVLNLNTIKEPPLSDNLENLILMKLDKLNFEEKNLIKILSIYGNKIDLGIFHEFKEKLDKLEKLTDFLIIDKKNGFLNFVDENTQKIIYDNLEFNFKRDEHLKIGDFLEKNLKEEPLRLFNLAYHYGQAEDKKALPFLSEISKSAENLYDLKGAIFYIEKFLKISEKYKLLFEDEVLRLSDLYLLSGLPEKGIKIIEDKKNLFKENILKFLLILSNCYKSMGALSMALKIINEAKNIVKSNYDLFKIKVQEARTLGQAGKLKEAEVITEELYRNFKNFRKYKEYYTILTFYGFFKIQRGELKMAVNLFENAINFFKKNNNFKELLNSYANLSSTIYANFLGDYEMALKYSRKAYNLALKFGFFELEALIKLEHNLALWYFLLENFKRSKEYLSKAISKGKIFSSDYLFKCFCLKAHLNLYLGNFNGFTEYIKKANELANKLNLLKDSIYQLNLYYYFLKKDKKNYYNNLKKYENLVKKENMYYLIPEILNFKAEGSLLFGDFKKFYKKEILNFKNSLKARNYYEAYRALRFLYLCKNDEYYFNKLKNFQKKIKDRKFKVEFLYFNYLRNPNRKNKYILLYNLKKYPYFDVKIKAYESILEKEKDDKLKNYLKKTIPIMQFENQKKQ